VVELRGAFRRGDHPGRRGLGGRPLPRGPRLPRRSAGRAAAASGTPQATVTGGERAGWPPAPAGRDGRRPPAVR
jgi:hypothetical protein